MLRALDEAEHARYAKRPHDGGDGADGAPEDEARRNPRDCGDDDEKVELIPSAAEVRPGAERDQFERGFKGEDAGEDEIRVPNTSEEATQRGEQMNAQALEGGECVR